MLFARSGELGDDDSVRQYIEDNDVVFSLSFGPVLVENGEVQNCESYPIGEVNTQYSRAGIGMTDKLHYLLMTVNHTDDRPRATVGVFAQLMQQMGCVKAYNLDGGQTSEIVMEGKPVNYIDFNAERTVSDIIYFATALPESEVTQ
jgi:exopolysaccharide biosynthesis protein